MQGNGIIDVGPRGFRKLLGHLLLRIAKNHAGLTFSLRLGLHRHRILESRRNENVLDLDRNDVDAPWLGAYVDDLLKFTADFFSYPSSMSESMVFPITSRRAVWEAQLMALL
jgi:hypothetical protein